MDLTTWRQQRQQPLVLSSGLTVTVRRVTLLSLAEHGSIPAPLVAQVEALMAKKKSRLALADVPKMREVLNVVTKASVIDPLVADEPSDNTLGVDELDTEDKLDIFNWALSGVAPLASFPGGTPGNSANTGHARTAIRDETEQPVTG